MSSRLDRLFLLLENGGSDATRQAAAFQLGEVVKIHPYELGPLLNRLHTFISSKTWETRIAAGHAVSAIVSNIPKWDPQPIKEEIKSEYAPNAETPKTIGHLSLESFKIRRVLEKGSYLFSADENQFLVDEEILKLDSKERAARQRLLVNQRLGLDIADALGINTQHIFSASDLTNDYSDNCKASNKNSVIDVVQEEMISAGLNMSSRERNRAKRKAKFMLNKQKSCNESSDKSMEDGPEMKRQKSHHESCDSDEEERHLTIVDEKYKQDDCWPLEEFTSNLTHDLFNPTWEVRHGAATALREVIRLQGQGAGKTLYQTAKQMEENQTSWLEDKALRIICVLALDRFGDFLADQVVAPVRETCAQVLGCIIQYLSERSILSLLSLLQEMMVWNDWGTRHGGLLGLKFLLAVRGDIRNDLLKKSFDYIFKGLKDEMDDVVAVAATCLVPVSEALVDTMPFEVINDLLGVLWEALLDIDDLTASTSAILLLISKLLSYQVILDKFVCDLSHLISRLWPFLYHSNSSVRTSTLKTIETLLENYFFQRKSAHGQNQAFTSISNDKCMKASKLNTEEVTLNKFGDGTIKSEVNGEKDNWLEKVLDPLLTHIYQRSLIENVQDNLDLIEKIWNLALKNASLGTLLMVACRLMPSWLCLLMTAVRAPLDSTLLLIAHHGKEGDESKTNKRSDDLGERVMDSESRFYLGGPRDGEEDGQAIEDQVIRARCITARLLGNLSHYVTQPMPSVEYRPEETPILCYVRLLVSHLTSRSGTQRLCAGLVMREWAIFHPDTPCHLMLQSSLLTCLQDTLYYDEITWLVNRIQQEVKDFLSILKENNVDVDSSLLAAPFLLFDQIKTICDLDSWNTSGFLDKKIYEVLQNRSKSILKNVSVASTEQMKINITVQSVIAGALIRFKCLPEKLNPVIKPLMESVKKESIEQLQKMSSSDLTLLLELCSERQQNPSPKIVKNLASFLCVDEDFTPSIINNSSKDLSTGILSLSTQNKAGNIFRRRSSATGRGPGRPPLKSLPSTSSDSNDSVLESSKDSEEKNNDAIQRRGCTFALRAIVSHFESNLESKLPHLLNMIFEPLENPPFSQEGLEAKQNVINWLQLLEVTIPVLHKKVLDKFDVLAKAFDSLLYNSSSFIRHMCCRVFATLVSASPLIFVCHMVENVVPNLDLVGSDPHRMGALECLHLTIEKLGFVIIPYIVLLIVPLLGSMSDPLEKVRHLGAQCFATLIRLFPLDGGKSGPLNISPKLSSQMARERLFLERLLDPSKIEDYKVPVPINAELRSYQQKGVNWLAFLKKFNLHGILCDDMGLGKTLQSICILAGDHHEKEEKFKKKKNVPCPPSKSNCQSLVVCPPTLTGHWFYEVTKFVSKEFLNPLHYSGPPIERKRLRNFFGDHNLIIASYKIVRNEVDYFSKVKWNYIILDEGHTIKNGKTKSSKAIKELVGKHRLILTGTPIQNNVLELWSLFDFLMPGFLGSERQFLSKYSKPILLSKEAKSSSKEQEDGVLAMEALHRQVLPFLLRRIKEDVLKDLPPKITQDYYCDLSPLQERLYEDFAKTHSSQGTENEDKKKPFGHIFQALQYLRRVCNHPKLALLPSHPQYEAISKQIRESRTPLSDISHSAKLPALKQLLLDCGIGVSSDDGFMSSNTVISPHRALIFCQLKGMLDIIEKDLLKVHLPNVTYLRLDGSVQANLRHNLIQRFNSDPSIDLLLLTTQVGGLGLNLTGADTVIFVEHDWNPMRDLQAMDRAHRIGQKRVVNVYRLITRGTLEEKIMSLQKFKLMTANSVITQENSSLMSMGTDQLLELFSLDRSIKDVSSGSVSSSKNESQTLGLPPVAGFKKALEGLPELWEEGLYEEEYNFDSFLKTLNKN